MRVTPDKPASSKAEATVSRCAQPRPAAASLRLRYLLSALAVAIIPAFAQAQTYAGAGCIASMENRSGLVDADGTYVIPNVPTALGQYKVHVVCPQPDGTLRDGYSPFYNLSGNSNLALPFVKLALPSTQPQSLTMAVLGGTLSAVGATVHLAVLALDSDGYPLDASLAIEGTTYITSNPAVATVSPDGVVTATGPGNVSITANNNGLVATIQIPSFAALDSDGDGLPDTWEIANGLNPYNANDGGLDPDNDGLTNLQEYQLGTNPHVADTDGDGLTDGQEIALGTNPLVADTDGDGLSDGQEVALGTNPLLADTDGDGIPDGIEVKIGTNPLVADVTTTVTGYVTNGDGSPSLGTSTVVFTYFNTITDSTGAFSIPYVPVTLGNIIATAEAVVNAKVFSGSSKSTVPVANAITNVGTISLGQAGGQVAGRVTTPDKLADQGVQVVVYGGADTRSAVTDSNGLYSVSGLQAGPVTVTAFDPATSLRAQASGLLPGSAPLTLNLQLSSFGTVSGVVTDVHGTPVGPGIAVVITGSLNAATQTDGVGHYSFAFVPLGAVIVDATDNTGNRGRTTATVTATAQTIVANIQYLGQGTVSGLVTDGGNNPVPGANVVLVNNGVISQRLSATANSVGQYSIAKVFIGAINLSAVYSLTSAAGYANTSITTNGQAVTANIQLQPTAIISGKVYRVDGATPVPGAIVSIVDTAATTTADANAAYTLPAVPLGNYRLIAADATGLDRGQVSVSLPAGGQTVTRDIDMAGLGAVNVTVLDGGGKPSSGAAVQLAGNDPFYQKLAGVSASDGTVTFSQVNATGNLVVTATSATANLGGRTTATLTAGQTLPVTVTLQSSGTVQGTVFQSDGATPLAGVTVVLNTGSQPVSVRTAADGTYSFSNVPSGPLNMSVVDADNNQLAYSNNQSLTAQGQVVTVNFISIARGTVTGTVTFSNGSAAANVPVRFTSGTANAGNPYGTATDFQGHYSFVGVPAGIYNITTQQLTAASNYYGTAQGSLATNGAVSVTNVVLSSLVVPSSVSYTDANGFQYAIRENGGIFDGSFNVFFGDSASNQGASLLSIVQNGHSTPFTGEDFAPVDLDGRQISYTQNGIAGLNLTRRVFVPADGYFARYLELLSNPGTAPVTVDVQLTSNFGLAGSATISNNTYFVSSSVPQIIATSSGDRTLNVNDPSTPDHWVTLGGASDRDPFLPDAGHIGYIPTVADVFGGTGAAVAPTSAVYNTALSPNNSALTETYGAVTVPAGGTVGILHFLSQENLYESAAAAANRLVQLPPEALAGITSSDLASIVNFSIPNGGVSTVPPLPALTYGISGHVFAADGTTPVPNALVYFTSSDPIYARFYEAGAAKDGSFAFNGSVGGVPVTNENFSLLAWDPTNVTPSSAACRQAGLFLGAGCAILSPSVSGRFAIGAVSATQDVTFGNTGILTGTISRGPTVLNAAGIVTLSGGLMNPVSVPIQADGTYTFLDVLPGSYIVEAFVTNTLLTGLTNTSIVAGQTTTANITIIQAGTITGLVIRPDKSYGIGDTVNLRIAGQVPATTTVDTSGHYAFTDVPIGPVEVDCYDALSNTAASIADAVANGVVTTHDLTLQSAGGVTGTVTVNDGSSVSGLTVTLTSTTTTGTQSLSTSTNNSGVFNFTNVTPGTIVVRATNAEGLQGTGSGALPLAGQTTTINISLIAAGNLQGTVYLGDGTTPAPGVSVTLSPAPLTGSATIATNATGQYSYTNVPVGSFYITATNTANGDQGTAFGQIQTIAQQRTLNVTLNGFGNLAVTILGTSGSPVSDASVTVTTGNINSTHTSATNASGIAQFNGIFAGPYTVSARDPVSGYSVQTSGTLGYNANATVTLTLQALGTIQGTVFAPDGVTPEAGVTVLLDSYKSTKTSASGTYQFASIPAGPYQSYSLSAQDTAGTTRVIVNNVPLPISATPVTQNLTFIGAGSVTGTVFNADGSIAQNVSLTLTSQNATFGGAQQVSAGSDGMYTFAKVPVGKFTVSVSGLPTGQIGYALSSIAADQASTVVDIHIQGNAVTLPVTLTDADGFLYVVNGDGTYAGNGSVGGNNPFSSAQSLSIGIGGTSVNFGSQIGAAAIQSMNGQQLELTAPVNGLTVTRKIYVPSDGYFARRLDVLANPTSSPVSVSVVVGGAGTDRIVKNGSVYVVSTSNGTTTPTSATTWVVDDDDTGKSPYPQTQPAIANVYRGTGAPTGLSALTYSAQSYVQGFGNNQYSLTYQNAVATYQVVTVPANSQVGFLYFTAQEATEGTAQTAAQRLVQLPAEALVGLSAADLASVVNFVVPATQTLPAVTPPAAGTLSGQVVAGDTVTPVPSAIVYAQSTDLQYGSGATTTADPAGHYTIPNFAATTFALEAVDPATKIASVTATGAFTPGSLAQTQNIPFTGTGILRGLVQTTGQTTIYNGSFNVSFFCASTNNYCGFTTGNIDSTGKFGLFTVPAGFVNVFANVYTSAAGGFYLTQNGDPISSGQTNFATLTLPATGNVHGTVTNADGTPAVGASVYATPGSTGTSETVTTGADGSYSFTGIGLDTYNITATDPVTSSQVSQSTTVVQDATNTVNLQFVGKGTVNLTLHYANGNIGQNATVYLYVGNQATTVNNYASCNRDPQSHCIYASGTTDSNGLVIFPNVPDGAFVIHAYYPGWNFFSTAAGSMTGNAQTVAIATTLTPVGTVSGNLTYANGTPAPGAYVTIADTFGTYTTNAQTDSAGNYAISPVPADRLVNLSSYNNTNNTTGHTVQAVANSKQVPGDGQTLTVNLRYPGSANVQVNLFNADGTPSTNTSITVYLNSADGVQRYAVNLGATGSATFTNVIEAPFVAFGIDYSNYTGFSVGSTTFALGAADDGNTKQVNITASPTGTVQGTLYAADGTTALQSGYNVAIADIDTGTTKSQGPTLPPGYLFTKVGSGASGFTVTPSYYLPMTGTVNYTALAFTGSIATQGQTVTHNFTLPLSVVSGTVFLFDGVTPVPNINVTGVQNVNGSNNYYNATTDANGNYQLIGALTGTLAITASDDNGVPGTTTATLPSDTAILTGKNVNLAAVGTVIGTVYDQHGNTVPDLQVVLTSYTGNNGIEVYATSDANGNFQATDVRIGQINVNVTLADGTAEQSTGYLNNNGDTLTLNVGTPPVPAGHIFGTVYDSNQDPAAGAVVTATASSNNATYTATTDDNGMYNIGGLNLDTYTVTAVLSDGVTNAGTTTGSIADINTPVEIDIGLQNYGAVSGLVTDINGDPIPNVNITLQSSADNFYYASSTDANGNYYFGSVDQGSIVVQVLDSNSNVIGTGTAVLPFGGNLVINVKTQTVGAKLQLPGTGASVPAVTLATLQAPMAARQSAAALLRRTHASSLNSPQNRGPRFTSNSKIASRHPDQIFPVAKVSSVQTKPGVSR